MIHLQKRAILFISILIFISNLGWSQGINNLWYLGYLSQAGPPWGGITMDFFSGAPVITYVSRPMEFVGRANSNIADANGNMLFYTNGYYIADASNDTMMNGSGINPSIYTSWNPDGLVPPQLNMILPDPGNNNLYHLIHCTVDDPPNNLVTKFIYESKIDMSLNGGLGAVTIKNNILLSDTLNPGKLIACKHGNGRDWWILCHKTNSNKYILFLLTPTGITGPYIQNIGILRTGGDAGFTCFSPDGSKFAYYNLDDDLDVFNFDRCTGLLSNPVHVAINDTSTGAGVAFSPNSQFLYVSSLRYVYQFDVNATNIPSTQTTVAIYDGFYSPSPPLGTYFDIAQLAPDGKIYISTGNGTFHLHVINQPDSAGLACDLVQHGLMLPAYYYNSLPNHPNYFLGALTGGLCDTLTSLTGELNNTSNELKVFPNPTDGKFTLGFSANSNTGLFEIFDAMGKRVFYEKVSQWSQYKRVNITNLPAGIYYCRIKWKDREQNTKVVKY